MDSIGRPPLPRPWSFMGRLGIMLDSIRFEHSIFALPFAYLGMILAADGLPTLSQFIWITVAMVAARTVAMSANRLIDREMDAENPRTSMRALPAKLLRPSDMMAMLVVSLIIFFIAAYFLNPLAFMLAPVAAVIVITYSYAKRFTWTGHYWLGFADGIAPAGGWIGVAGELPLEAVILAMAVTTWVAGFDLIYQCMDYDFDVPRKIHTIPAKWGIAAALRWSRATHFLTIVFLVWLGIMMSLAWPYYIGVAIAAALLAWEHSLVKADDFSRVTMAFFNINGVIAIIVFVFTVAAVLVG